MEMIMLRWASRIESRVVMVRSLAILKRTVGGSWASKLRHQGFNPRDRVDDIGIRLAVDLDLNHRIAVDDAEVADIFIAIDHAAQIRQADRRAVAIDHHQILVFFRQEKLVGGIDRKLNLGVRERALRAGWHWRFAGTCRSDRDPRCSRRAAADSLRREPREASFHPPDTWPTPLTCDSFCANTEEAMSYNCGLRHHIRLERHQQDRLVGRIDFPVSGELRKIRREKSRPRR